MTHAQPSAGSEEQGKTVVIVGLGNIGSYLVPLIGRMVAVKRTMLIDFDRYETRNVDSQDVECDDLDEPKALARARRMRRTRPDVDVESVVSRVEHVPLGQLRGDIILSGLDSRAARQRVNEAASRLGVPWVDGAVQASGLLARVTVFVPGAEGSCLECAWDDADYAAVEQIYPCYGGENRPATNAPAALGAVVAGLMALEAQKVLADDLEHALVGRQVFLDLQNHAHYVTAIPRNPNCRFDHETWSIERLSAGPDELTIGQLMELARHQGGPWTAWTLEIENKAFVRRLYCPACGSLRDIPICLAHRLPASSRICPSWQMPMVLRGVDLIDRLELGTLLPDEKEWPLSRFGMKPAEVLTVRRPNGEGQHFELGPSDSCSTRDWQKCEKPAAIQDSEQGGIGT